MALIIPRVAALLVTVLSSALLASCDAAGVEPDPSGDLAIMATFPDGTPATVRVSVTHFDPKRPPEQAPLFQAERVITGGSHIFEDVPAGRYSISVLEPLMAPSAFYIAGPQHLFTDVPADGGAVAEIFGGYRDVDAAVEIAGVASLEREEEWANPRGHVALLRYGLDALRIGQRHDLVRSVSSREDTGVVVGDLLAEAVDVMIYRIPDGMTWSSSDTGDLTYELFRSELVADTSFTLFFDRSESPVSVEALISLRPAMFLGATNGIAVLAEGRQMMDPPEVYPLYLEYTWEE